MGAVLTLRQRRADDTHRRLFAAAVKLFSERGYFQTTVDDICKRAGVAKGTFFIHFATKDAVIDALVDSQVSTALRAQEDARARGTPVDALRAAALGLGERAGESRALSQAVLTATMANPTTGGSANARFDQVFQGMISDARAAQRQGLLAREPDAFVIASTVMASYLGAALHFTTSPGAPPLLEVLRPIVDANLRGFAAAAKKRRGK